MATPSISPLTPFVRNPSQSGYPNIRENGHPSTPRRDTPGPGLQPRTLVAESFRAESLIVEFENNDGDKVTISAQSLEYRKAAIMADQGDEKARKELVKSIAEEVRHLHRELLKRFFDSLKGKSGNDQNLPDAEVIDIEDEEEIAGLPEYWNAENTSQRIADFAVSFSGVAGLEDGEFVERIRAAIEEGFAQAREMLGELSGPVGKLIDKTYDLTIKKIDEWAMRQTASSPAAV